MPGYEGNRKNYTNDLNEAMDTSYSVSGDGLGANLPKLVLLMWSFKSWGYFTLH